MFHLVSFFLDCRASGKSPDEAQWNRFTQSFSPAMTKVLFLVSLRLSGDTHTRAQRNYWWTAARGCCVTSAPPHSNKENGSRRERETQTRQKGHNHVSGEVKPGFQPKRPSGSRKQWGTFYNPRWELWAAVDGEPIPEAQGRLRLLVADCCCQGAVEAAMIL